MKDPDFREEAEKYACETFRPNQGPCLVPKPGRQGISCHENDFCECEVLNAFEAGAATGYTKGKAEKERDQLEHHLAEAQNDCKALIQEVEKQDAEIAALKAEVKRLNEFVEFQAEQMKKSVQSNNNLCTETVQLKAELAIERESVAKLREALEEIASVDTETDEALQSGCAEVARQALLGTTPSRADNGEG
jgi:predicted nuclease with TOPRIM domain